MEKYSHLFTFSILEQNSNLAYQQFLDSVHHQHPNNLTNPNKIPFNFV